MAFSRCSSRKSLDLEKKWLAGDPETRFPAIYKLDIRRLQVESQNDEKIVGDHVFVANSVISVEIAQSHGKICQQRTLCHFEIGDGMLE